MVEVTASSEVPDAGTSFSLICTVTSDFPASITWLSGQQPVLPSTADNISITHETLSDIQTDEESTIEISPDEINSSYKLILVIQSYNAMDSGSYTCSTLVETIAGKSVFVLPGNPSSSLTVVATNGRPICTHVMDICNT